MLIDFNIQKNDGTFLAGNDLLKDPKSYREELLALNYVGGSITIATDETVWDIEDELAPLLYHFCLLSLPRLVQDGKYRFNYFEIHGIVDLESADGFVLISGSFIETILVVRDEFIPQALQCVLRYIDFFQKLNEPKFNNDWKLLAQTADEMVNYLQENYPEYIK